jgi:GNAT superfamily N-acetyltransferase
MEQIEQELPARADQTEASQEAERRIQQAADAPRYQQNGDGSYQRHFSDRQGRDVTLRVEGNDADSLARAAGDQRLHSQHGIRLRAVDTAEAQTPPAFHGKGEMGRANLTLETERTPDGAVTDRRLRLNDVEVNDNYRSRGVGGELLTEAERIGHQHQAREVYGNFEPDPGQEVQVRSFYEHHGYQLRLKPGGGEEVYKTLRQPESDAAALRRAVAR